RRVAAAGGVLAELPSRRLRLPAGAARGRGGGLPGVRVAGAAGRPGLRQPVAGADRTGAARGGACRPGPGTGAGRAAGVGALAAWGVAGEGGAVRRGGGGSGGGVTAGGGPVPGEREPGVRGEAAGRRGALQDVPGGGAAAPARRRGNAEGVAVAAVSQ